MKKISKLWLLLILPALGLGLIMWHLIAKIPIQNEVTEHCSQFSIGDEWVGCVIDLALEKKDANYCRTQSIFSPYPGICMEKFAQGTEDKNACETIHKPRYKEECLKRFE